MARYDLMLGVTSAEAFVLLNQEVSLFIHQDHRDHHPYDDDHRPYDDDHHPYDDDHHPYDDDDDNDHRRRWSLVLRQRDGTSLCQILSPPPSR